MQGILYLVSTPIGNLGDISERALHTLRTCSVIACEDTRHTGKLLAQFGIENKLVSCHEHNEAERAGELLKILADGRDVALVSDAGTPAISDPGYRLVRAVIEAGLKVVSVPGPTALIAALTVSGLPTDTFYFGGFLPSRRGDRVRRLTEAAKIPSTLIFYESPHRLQKSLTDCLEVFGDRQAAVVREATKLFEETVRGCLSEVAARFEGRPVKGEIVLVIDGRSPVDLTEPKSDVLESRYTELIQTGLESKKALKQAAKEQGISRSEAYRRLHIGDDPE